MKYRIFLASLFFSLIFLPSVYSQLGLKGGLGVSDIVFAKEGQIPYLGYEGNLLHHRVALLTYQIGVFSTFDISQRFSFQPELLYVTNGLDYRSDFLYDDVIYKVNIHYLHIPLLVRLNTAVQKEKYSGLYVGPYFSWKLRSTKLTEIEGEREKSSMPNVKAIDWGGIVGYSFDVKLPAGELVIDFRGSYSLMNMMNPVEGFIPWYYGSEAERARNVTITLGVGYRFIDL